jgi:hypothetical protein
LNPTEVAALEDRPDFLLSGGELSVLTALVAIAAARASRVAVQIGRGTPRFF